MDKLEAFHKTKRGHLTFGFGELVLVYILGSIAIDTANMWAYLATILLFVGACHNFLKFNELKKSKPKGKQAHARK